MNPLCFGETTVSAQWLLGGIRGIGKTEDKSFDEAFGLLSEPEKFVGAAASGGRSFPTF